MNEHEETVTTLESVICPALDDLIDTHSTALSPAQATVLERVRSALDDLLYDLTHAFEE